MPTEENRIGKCVTEADECALLNSVITPEELDTILQQVKLKI